MIDQAVILCGGLGTRLLPITKNTPKPMVDCDGKPFLWHLLSYLKKQKIKKILLLTGYLSNQIVNYFGNGQNFGLTIKYHEGPINWDTGRRIWEANDKIDKDFLLLYSDNFSLVDLSELYLKHKSYKNCITFTIAKKEQGNVKIDKTTNKAKYGSEKIESNFVEIGFMIVNKKKMFTYYKDKNCNFSEILKNISYNSDLGFYIQNDSYYSTSDINRLKKTRSYLTKKNIILLDRDGILNKKAEKARYITRWNEFVFIKKNIEGLKKLAKKKFNFIIITNQAGLNRGIIKQKDFNYINKKMILELKKNGIKVLKVYYCPHHWDEKCLCRKPNAQMFFDASKEYLFRLDQVVYVGDDPRDMMAVNNAKAYGVFIGNEKQLGDINTTKVIDISKSILEAEKKIIQFYDMKI